MVIFNPEMFLGNPYAADDQRIQLPYAQIV